MCGEFRSPIMIVLLLFSLTIYFLFITLVGELYYTTRSTGPQLLHLERYLQIKLLNLASY